MNEHQSATDSPGREFDLLETECNYLITKGSIDLF